MEHKSYESSFEAKATGENNLQVTGYASIFNFEDSAGDIISPGAFKNAIAKKKVMLLWQHDQTKPIGVIEELYEDNKGLVIKATINGSTQYGKDAKSLIEQGAINSFSIGFYTKKSFLGQHGGRVITEVDLWEVSIVTFPCNEGALITNIATKSEKLYQHNRGEIMNIVETPTINEERFKKVEKSLDNIETMLSRPDIASAPLMDTKFSHFLRSGALDLESKSLTSLNDGDGGFMIRPELSNKIAAGIKAKSPIRQLASVETISTNALDVLLEHNKFVSNWVADAAARPDTDNPTLIQKRITVHELYSQPKATQRLLDDSAINIENWIAERLEDSFARVENASFILGDGTNKPRGILNYGNDTISRVNTSTSGEIHAEDILNLINAIDEYYLPNATFLMHRTTLAKIQALQDNNGHFLWQASLADKAPGTLFGIPVVCSSDMPVFQTDNLSIILADFKAGYKIVDKVGIHSLRDQYTEKPFVKFYTVKRVGGDVVDPNAIKVMKI